jgi:phosphatidylserine/phosphatidylglycerophosphate/cardiolipin synthase-like enzyme
MNGIRKNLLILLLMLLVYGWYFLTNLSTLTQKPSVLGAASNVSLFVQPEAGEGPIFSAIDSAKSEVLVKVYLLSDKNVISSLISAKNRGVSVKILLEKHPFGGGNLNNKTKAILEKNGVLVEWSNPKYSLTHEKSIIIDKSYVYILNQNLTASAFTKNREYNVIDIDPKDVLEARNIFIADWERKDYQLSKSNLLVSPYNSRVEITALLKSTQKTIDIEMEVVEDKDIIMLLSQKAKNSTIRILAPPATKISTNGKSLKELKKAGILVKTLNSPYVHAKLIISDAKKAYIGSINFSSQSMDSNRELGIIITDKNILNSLLDTFNSDWEKGVDLP